jgi:hypothetical protein
MPSGKSSKAVRQARARSVVSASKPKPWGTIVAVLAILAFAGGVFGYLFNEYQDDQDEKDALKPYTPSASQQDPSTKIADIKITPRDQLAAGHVTFPTRVAYTDLPPVGGAHDGIWASCNGVVYGEAVRTENMVHTMEHGAVWIAYNPDQISGAALDKLKGYVDGEIFITLSPFPGLSSPISLQSWGHKLALTDPNDERIKQFITALRLNQYQYPEVGATCDTHPQFDQDNPPAFDPTPPGPDAQSPSYSAGR